ncbi:MAG: TIGR03560 family F420-dependent LLM class oxidoreductase, partial [Candidatus Rokuibacteriota bacterium]
MKKTLMLLVILLLVSNAVAQPAASPPAKRILFGIQTTPQDFTYDQLVTIWKDADALGFDSAWVFDHLIPILGADTDGPCLEGWTLLSALAAETERIRIGALVTGNTYRNPALLAKMAATVDHISNGRLYLGIGAAWFEFEHEAYGFPFYTAKGRAERLDEALQVIKKLWTEDHPSFAGKFYTLKNAPFAPKPVQKPHPPIIVGGQGEQWIMPLVGRYADG